jgi:A/G-specific adenine glycosylase
LESDESINWDQLSILNFLSAQFGIHTAIVKDQSALFTQQLTHQQIKAKFIHVELLEMPDSLQKLDWYQKPKIAALPFPKIINEWLSKNKL